MAVISSPKFGAIPLFMQAVAGDDPINYSAADFRALVKANWLSGGAVTATSFRVEQADVVGWSIKIRPGYAVLGDYLVANYDAITVNVSALNTNPSGTRTHRVYLIVQNKVNGGTADGYYAQIKVVEDFAGGTTGNAEAPDAAAVMLLAAFTISPGQGNIQNAQISAKPRMASFASDFTTFDTDIFAAGIRSADDQADTAPARARFGSSKVELSGSIRRTSGSGFPTGSTVVGTLPWFLRPRANRYLIGATSGATYWRLVIAADGTMTANIPGDNAPLYLYLDSMNYEIT